jgi:hypothetical protein
VVIEEKQQDVIPSKTPTLSKAEKEILMQGIQRKFKKFHDKLLLQLRFKEARENRKSFLSYIKENSTKLLFAIQRRKRAAEVQETYNPTEEQVLLQNILSLPLPELQLKRSDTFSSLNRGIIKLSLDEMIQDGRLHALLLCHKTTQE